MTYSRGNSDSLMLALGREAQTYPSENRFEVLHNVTLDYVMSGLDTETICGLLRQFNDARVPIHQLPRKVIFRIFETLWKDTEASYRWLSITLVCRRWKSLAYSCTRLWSVLRFDVMMLEVALRFAERSAPGPMKWIVPNYKALERRYKGFHDKFSELFKLMLDRIEFLDLDMQGHYNILEILAKPAPQLKYLRICGAVSYVGEEPSPAALPELSSTSPMLRHVVIDNELIWPTVPFKNLDSLISTWQHFYDPISTNVFFKTLRCSPSLSVLSLGTDTMRDSLIQKRPMVSRLAGDHDNSPINLPNVRKISLTYISISALRYLTKRVKVPVTANFVMGISSETHGRSCAALIDTFLTYPAPISELGHVILLVSNHPSIYRYNLILQGDKDTLPPRLWHRNSYADTVALVSDTRLSGLLTLTVRYPQPFTVAKETYTIDWEKILPQFTRLCTIRVFNENPIPLISALLPTDQVSALEKWETDVRSALFGITCTQDHHDVHTHFLQMIGVSMCGEPALARIVCGCRPSRLSQQNEMYVMTVIVKGNGTSGYDKQRLCRWLDNHWTDLAPLQNNDIKEMIDFLTDMPSSQSY